MKKAIARAMVFCALLLVIPSALSGQDAPLPRLIKYTGSAPNGTSSATFAIYATQDGPSPLWLETQAVTLDETGHYTVLLGATKAEGLPSDIFASGEARWIGVKVGDSPEGARTLLVSVPYALKAGDAETLGGKPLSAFVLSEATVVGGKSARVNEAGKAAPEPTAQIQNGGSNGTANTIAKFDSPTSIVNSVITEVGGNVGFNTANPVTALDVGSTGGDIALGYNFQGLSQFFKTFGTPHSAANVPSQLNMGLFDGAFTGFNVKNVRDGSFNSASIEFSTHHGGVSFGTRVTIDKDGRMGIGTTAPGFPLEVIGEGHAGVFSSNQFKGGTFTDGFINWGAAQINRSGGAIEFQFPGGGGSDVHYFANTANPITFLGLNGNMGVGTVSPAAKLQVVGTAMANNFTDGFINWGLAQINRSGGAIEFQFPGGSGNDVHFFGNTAHPVTFLGSNGNVGIGTSSPTTALDVAGMVRASTGVKFADSTVQTTALPAGCTTNQIPKWNGTAWVCSADQSGTGGLTFPFDSGNQTTTSGAFIVRQSNSVVTGNPSFTDATTTIPGAVAGFSSATSNTAAGVSGFANSPNAVAVLGWNGATNATGSNGSHSTGVLGRSDDPNGVAIQAENDAASGNSAALKANTESPNGIAIEATANNGGLAGNFNGPVSVNGNLQVQGVVTSNSGPLTINSALNLASSVNGPTATFGSANIANIGSNSITASNGSLVVNGNLSVSGTLSKGSGTFEIDHPLDPAGKYLYHSFVESPDMMNIYNGIATLDSKGRATITMPDYFEALNMDFRYQLTAMGASMPGLYVAKEVSNNRFEIAGGKPNARVSWQVTGIRHDAFANAHRVQVEVEKPAAEQGTYLHPELFSKDGKDKLAAANHK